MDIKLIKELNERVREKDEFETALAEAGIDFDMGNDVPDEEFPDVSGMGDEEDMDMPSEDEIDTEGSDEELERVADDLRDDAEELEDDELRDAIGDELEALEYEPDAIADGIDTVMTMLGREEVEDEMADDAIDDEIGSEDMDLEDDMGGEDMEGDDMEYRSRRRGDDMEDKL